jgi:hypothetical protein
MTALGGLTPTYDANGNLRYDTYNNYAWDAENDLELRLPSGKGTSRGLTTPWPDGGGGQFDQHRLYLRSPRRETVPEPVRLCGE